MLDVPDPNAPRLPSVPYSEELEKELAVHYKIVLADIVPQLFAYQSEPSEVKCIFWDAVSRVYEKAFSAQLEAACAQLGKKLTGHVFFEEKPFENMIFHANPFKVLKHFHRPGIDLLSNKLSNISIYAHKMAFSCAFLTGGQGIMSETSDFCEHRLGERQAASPEEMLSALSMQFLLGVRDFALYYDFRVRKAEDYRWVTERVSKLCTLAQDLAYSADAALYCPFETFWSGYVPTVSEFSDVILDQPADMQRTEDAVLELCDSLFQRNIQFVLCDSSSVQDLVRSGVRHVFIPWCTVIAQELADAAAAGKIVLYGHTPPYVYGQGKLQKLNRLAVESEVKFQAQEWPLSIESELCLSAFTGGHYFIFNPSRQVRKMIPHQNVSAYNPHADNQKRIEAGHAAEIQPGGSLWITIE